MGPGKKQGGVSAGSPNCKTPCSGIPALRVSYWQMSSNKQVTTLQLDKKNHPDSEWLPFSALALLFVPVAVDHLS